MAKQSEEDNVSDIEPSGLVQDQRTVQIYDFEGVKYSEFIPKSTLEDMKTFEVRDDDIYVIAYPKSGVHWMSEIVALIIADGDLEKVDHSFLQGALGVPMASDPADPFGSLVPYHKVVLDSMPSPRLIMTHLPVKLMPPSFWTRKPKAIYVARNPRDVAISYHQFWKLPGDEDFNDFVTKRFLTKDMIGQCPMDHCIGYWKHRNDENILFVKYEDIKRDPALHVQLVTTHLGRSLSDDLIQRCVEGSTIDTMKETYARIEKEEKHGILKTKAMGQADFLRTGEVGTWKEHFTVALNEHFEKVYQQMMAGSGLVFDFE